MIFYLLMSLLTVGTLSTEAKEKKCSLTDAFVHKNEYTHQIVLHSNCPVDHFPMNKENDHEVRFFIPLYVKDATTLKNIQKMNETASGAHYKVKFVIRDNGIECVVNLNPAASSVGRTALELQKAKSITGKHSLLVKLHDGDVLNKMQAESNNKRIKRLAYGDVLPKKCTIALDFGHGGNDTGYSDKNGLYEKNVNREIGDKVASLLKKKITRSV